MGFTEWLLAGVLALLATYMVARLISAAYFKSKQQYEQSKGHRHERS